MAYGVNHLQRLKRAEARPYCCTKISLVGLLLYIFWAVAIRAHFNNFFVTVAVKPQLHIRHEVSVGLLNEKKQDVYKATIKKVCQQIEDGVYVIPPSEQADTSSLKALVDNYHQVVYCEISKVASGSFFDFFQILILREEPERHAWFKKHRHPFYSNGDHYMPYHDYGLSRLTKGYEAGAETKAGLPNPREKYVKFIVVRHPLDRLASAFMDKLNGAKGLKTPVQRMKAIANGKQTWDPNFYANVTFEEYLIYCARPDLQLVEKMDYHFLGYQGNCEPCSIDYDYIVHLETLSEDLPPVLAHLNATDLLYQFPTNKLNVKRDHKYAAMYLKMPFSIMKPLVDKCRADADMFGYTFDAYLRDEYKKKIPWMSPRP